VALLRRRNCLNGFALGGPFLECTRTIENYLHERRDQPVHAPGHCFSLEKQRLRWVAVDRSVRFVRRLRVVPRWAAKRIPKSTAARIAHVVEATLPDGKSDGSDRPTDVRNCPFSAHCAPFPQSRASLRPITIPYAGLRRESKSVRLVRSPSAFGPQGQHHVNSPAPSSVTIALAFPALNRCRSRAVLLARTRLRSPSANASRECPRALRAVHFTRRLRVSPAVPARIHAVAAVPSPVLEGIARAFGRHDLCFAFCPWRINFAP
jgi:hypothetical protein